MILDHQTFETSFAEGMKAWQQLSIGVSVQADRTFKLGRDPL